MKIRELIEALGAGFSRKKVEKGEAPFRVSTLTDPHIRAIVDDLSKRTGVPTEDIDQTLEAKMKKYVEVGKHSPILYDTLIKNAAENAVFEHISESYRLKSLDLSDIQFNEIIFKKLVKLIQKENTAFFPLQPKGDYRPLYKIPTIIVPSYEPKYKKYNNTPTAAVYYDKADFVFNREFMQKLIYYATVIGLKPKGEKYISNGGTIPDNYAYIEFVIMHELLHYAYADYKLNKRYPQYSHTAHNWAKDFRSNYMLVKSGYEQLPMGLFSEDLNFDRKDTATYEKLIRVLDQELKKLPKPLRAWVESEVEMDVHENEDDGPWSPKVGEIVLNNKTGNFVIVTKVNENGTAEVEALPPEDEAELRKFIKVG